MGWRWECLDCDYLVWDEKLRKIHETKKHHRMWGGSKVWSHPDGEYCKWFRKMGYGRDFRLYSKESNDEYILHCNCKPCRVKREKNET